MLRFLLAAAAIYVAIGGLAWLLIRFLPTSHSRAEAIFPPIFWLSSLLLLGGSASLHRAVGFVRLERQAQFRKSLITGLALGGLFVAVQSYGLATMIRHQVPEEAEPGSNAFLAMLAALHAMHFTLAVLLLVWVTVNAAVDRYDHEYYVGAAVCAWFWHGLGVVWALIMIIFLIATNFQSAPDSAHPHEEQASGATSVRRWPRTSRNLRLNPVGSSIRAGRWSNDDQSHPLTLRSRETTIHTES